MSLGGWRQATTLRTSPTMFPRRASAASSHLLFSTLTSWFHCAHPVAVNHLVVSTVWLGSAVRVSELCGLCWRDVQANGDGGQITVFGKGDQTRSIQLPASVWKSLEKPRGDACDDQPLFPSRKRGGPLKPLGVLRIVRRAAVRAGIDLAVSPHWMRHAHASHSLDRGAPIHLVQATLGHASIITTGRYLHARPKDSSGRFLAL